MGAFDKTSRFSAIFFLNANNAPFLLTLKIKQVENDPPQVSVSFQLLSKEFLKLEKTLQNFPLILVLELSNHLVFLGNITIA